LPFLKCQSPCFRSLAIKGESQPARQLPSYSGYTPFQFFRRSSPQKATTISGAYGYFPACSQKNKLLVFRHESDDAPLVFSFPLLKSFPETSVADFFLPREAEKKDVVAFLW